MTRRPIRLISEAACKLAAAIRREVLARLGPNSTFEERRDAAAALASDALWEDADVDLRAAVTAAEQVEVDGHCYRRLEQPSSATYHGRWGDHHIDEALYRQVGVHNGPTIKPIELRAGIVKQMTPDMARIVGELGAEAGSRGGPGRCGSSGSRRRAGRSSRSERPTWATRSPGTSSVSSRLRVTSMSCRPTWGR